MRFPHVCDLFGIFRDDEYTYVATSCSTKLSQERETLDAERPQNLKSWGWTTEGDLFHWVEHLCISPGPDREWALAFREFKSHWWDMMKSWPRAAWLRRDSAHDAAAVLWHEMCQFSLILSATYNICGLTNQKGSLSWRKPWPSLDYCRIVSICFHSAFHLRYDHLNGTIKHPCTSWKDLLSISLDSAVQWWDV